MPLVKQRGLLLMGNFSFQVNHTVKHDMWFNNAPWNDAASVWGVRMPQGLGAGAAPAEEAADSVNPAAEAIMRNATVYRLLYSKNVQTARAAP